MIRPESAVQARRGLEQEEHESLHNSGAVDEPTVQSETDRYIAWPAQALSYKLGQLKFHELRERAQKELGSKFDIRSTTKAK